MMHAPEILVVPSAYDALSAKVIQQAGFKAVHMTGSGTSASMLGMPGLDEAIRRSREYVAAGADCIFLEAMLTVDEMKRVRDEIDAPLLANMVEGGKTPWLTTKELEAIGYNLAIYPLSGWMAAASVL